MSLLLTGATIIDGVAQCAIVGQSILVAGDRITAIGPRNELDVPPDAEIIDLDGKFIIPGLMNANVHLLLNAMYESLVRYEGRYEELIVEAAQVALKSGLTTVFDSWGPRRALQSVRDGVENGEIVGSRIRLAGNILGFEGPFSGDFDSRIPGVGTTRFVDRVNATWVENTGRHLMWLTPGEVAEETRTYISRGTDFVKYASNEHGSASAGAFLQFSERTQRAIVDAAHSSGVTAQSHVSSAEGLRMAIEAGCDLVQHANVVGPREIPEETLALLAEGTCAVTLFPTTQSGLEYLKTSISDFEWTLWKASDSNSRRLLETGAPILMASDGGILAREIMEEPLIKSTWNGMPERDALVRLGTGHFAWLRAMEELGMLPMDMLQAATINIAKAYHVDDDLGSLEPGKVADIVVLDADPLTSAENYEKINSVFKNGELIDRCALPENALLTAELPELLEEESRFKRFLHHGER